MQQESANSEFSLCQSAQSLVNYDMNKINPKSKHRDDTAALSARHFDSHILAIAEQKDRKAFIALFEYYAPRVKSFLMRGGLSDDIADELAQDTLLSVWEKSAGFDPDKASASTWIYTIARNKKIDYMRREFRPAPDKDDPALSRAEPDAPDLQITNDEQADMVEAAMEGIPDEQRNLLEKAFFEDKTHKQIATETGLPLGTVKSRIRLAMDRMRHALAGKDMSS